MKCVNKELQQTKYYIGIDWGLNKTGLAIADDELRIATVLDEIETTSLIEEIKKLKFEYAINKVIFGGLGQGEQFNDNSSEGSRIEKIKKQCLVEVKELGVEVEISEEMLSTKMAQQNLLESGKKMVSKKDNGESAKIILQGWLDNY